MVDELQDLLLTLPSAPPAPCSIQGECCRLMAFLLKIKEELRLFLSRRGQVHISTWRFCLLLLLLLLAFLSSYDALRVFAWYSFHGVLRDLALNPLRDFSLHPVHEQLWHALLKNSWNQACWQPNFRQPFSLS